MTTTPQSMSDDELPLPAAGYGQGTNIPLEIGQPLFTADQLHAVRAQAFHDGQVAGRATAEQAGKVEGRECELVAKWLHERAEMASARRGHNPHNEGIIATLDRCARELEARLLAKPTQPAATQPVPGGEVDWTGEDSVKAPSALWHS